MGTHLLSLNNSQSSKYAEDVRLKIKLLVWSDEMAFVRKDITKCTGASTNNASCKITLSKEQ